MIHPECEHDCTSNCRREGCECLCGEYHDSYEPEEENQFPSPHEKLRKKLTNVAFTKKQAEAILEVIYDIAPEEE